MEKFQDFLKKLMTKEAWVKAFARLWARKKWRFSLLSLASLVLIFGFWGTYHYSKASLVARYIAARSASGPTFENIKEYLVWDDTDQLITNDEAAYTEFAALETEAEQEETKNALLTAKANEQVYVKRVGSRWGIFPDYRIAIKPLSLTVKTNLPGLDILLNDKLVTTSDSEAYSYTLDHLPEGDYTFALTGQYDGKTIDFSKAYDGKDQTIDLSVAFKTFTVTSNLTDGELYFGANRIGSLDEGKYEVKEFPVNDSVKVYVSKKFSDGTLKSKEEDLSAIADNASLALDIDNLLTSEAASQLLQTAFSQFSVYSSTGQDASDLAATFENGATNEFYTSLKESIQEKTQTASRKPSSLVIGSPSLTDFRQTGVKSYALSYAVSYSYYYDESTDPDKKTAGYLIQTYIGQIKIIQTDQGTLIASTGHNAPQLYHEDNQLKSPDPIPEELVGTWKISDDDKTVTMTLAADGTISKKTDYKDDKKKDTTKTAKISQAEEISDGLYRYHYESGDKAAFTVMDDIGANSSYTYGVRLSGSDLVTVYWSSADTSSSPQTGKTLTKD